LSSKPTIYFIYWAYTTPWMQQLMAHDLEVIDSLYIQASLPITNHISSLHDEGH